MTRYTSDNPVPIHMVGPTPSSDADGDPLTISHLGLTATPAAVDWTATPVVSLTLTALGSSTLEITQSGIPVLDDHGNPANHPGAGGSVTVRVYYRVTDGKGGVSGVGWCDCTFSAPAAETTPPTLASLSPAINATEAEVDTLITATFTEALQQGTGTITLWDATNGAAIQSFAIPAVLGVGVGKVNLSGATLSIVPSANLPNGIKVALRWTAGVVKDLPGNPVAAQTDDSVSFTTVPVVSSTLHPDDPSGWRGQSNKSYGTVLGTDFDYLVDPAGGGTHTTIAAAIAAASSGKAIAVRAGTYYESFTTKSGLTIQSYGAERPTISGQTLPLTGFVRCGAGDAAVLGATLGAAGSPVWKKTGIAKSTFPVSELLALNVTEGLVPLSNAQDRLNKTNLFDREDEQTYYDPVANGGNFLTTGGGVAGTKVLITDIKDPAVINSSRYTAAQLLGARVWLYVDPNESVKVTVTAVDLANNTISVNGGYVVNNDGRKRYALGNMGFAMVQGTWIYVDGGGSTFDLYVWPISEANLDKIAYAARKTIASLPSGSPANVMFKGINFFGGTGTADKEGVHILDSDNSNTSTGLLVENCRFTAAENLGFLHACAVRLLRSDTFTFQWCTFEWCSAHGIFPEGSTVTQVGALVRRNVFRNCGSAGVKAYKNSQFAAFHNYYDHCGYRSHGNLGNVYQPADKVLWWGNVFFKCQGYLTSQNGTDHHAMFNFAPIDTKTNDGRKFFNQGHTGLSYFCNNEAPPTSAVPFTVGKRSMWWGRAGLTLEMHNNIGHGLATPGDMGGTVNAYHNLNTMSGGDIGTGSGTLGPEDFDGSSPNDFNTTNVYNTDLPSIYRDYLAGDYRPASAASPQLTMATTDITTFVANLKGWFPMVPAADFDKDCRGGPINYGALKMGPDQSISYP